MHGHTFAWVAGAVVPGDAGARPVYRSARGVYLYHRPIEYGWRVAFDYTSGNSPGLAAFGVVSCPTAATGHAGQWRAAINGEWSSQYTITVECGTYPPTPSPSLGPTRSPDSPAPTVVGATLSPTLAPTPLCCDAVVVTGVETYLPTTMGVYGRVTEAVAPGDFDERPVYWNGNRTEISMYLSAPASRGTSSQITKGETGRSDPTTPRTLRRW